MINLELHEQALHTIMGALSKLPWDVANPVMAELDRQARPQLLAASAEQGIDSADGLPIKSSEAES